MRKMEDMQVITKVLIKYVEKIDLGNYRKQWNDRNITDVELIEELNNETKIALYQDFMNEANEKYEASKKKLDKLINELEQNEMEK